MSELSHMHGDTPEKGSLAGNTVDLNTGDASSPNRSAAKKARERAQRKHVLIIDNNPVMGRILGRIFDRTGLQFSVARNGKEAIEFCRNASYDLILTEARMPGIDGRVTAQKIRTLNAHFQAIPIIALDTNFSEVMIRKNRACGITAELKKPIIEFDLLQTLAAHMDIDTEAAQMHPPEDDEIYAVLDKDEMSLVNWETLKEYNAILKEDYKTLMRDFLTASPDLIGEIGEAVVDKDAHKIEFLAHKLKSTSLIFGAEGVSNVAAQLEMLGRGENLEDAGQYYKELHMSFERVKPVLRKKLVLMYSPV
jgi:CheY-like chemotaxis protein/HPt (histidine-containing phosphotransfer) domain-containing protein